MPPNTAKLPPGRLGLTRDRLKNWLDEQDQSPEAIIEKLRKWSNAGTKKHTLSAGAATPAEVRNIFNLSGWRETDPISHSWKTEQVWSLHLSHQALSLDPWTQYGMTLQETLVDHHNETGARILIDLLLLHALARIPGSGVPGFSDFLARLFPGTSLIETTGQQTHMSDHVVRQCLEHLEKAAVLCREILAQDNPPQSSETQLRTVLKELFAFPHDVLKMPEQTGQEAGRKLKMFPEQNVSIEVGDTLCVGRADYCLGYEIPGEEQALDRQLVVVEAKRREGADQSAAITQALFYVGTIRVARKKRGVANNTIYAIATNSIIWTFIRVDNAGQVSVSSDFSLKDPSQKHCVYGFLREVVSLCRKQSPTCTPTMPGDKQRTEVDKYALAVESESFEIPGLELELIETDSENEDLWPDE